MLLAFIEKRALQDPEAALYQLYDSFVYCVPLELKKVLNTELLDISVARQADSVRTRVENSHGILKDCFQQSVVQLAQAFDPTVDGSDIFPDFHGQARAIHAPPPGARRVDQGPARVRDPAGRSLGPPHEERRSPRFYDHNIKDLMYRDWSGFEEALLHRDPEVREPARPPADQPIASTPSS